MKFLYIIFVLLFIPEAAFSQPKSKEKYFPEAKSNFRKAVKFYLKKQPVPTPGITKQYASLFSDVNNYTGKDRLLALKLIKRLYQFDDILFFRLMRIRLEWIFKQRLTFSSLYESSGHIKNNASAANYSLMLGIYFKDTLIERVARHMGYVKAINDSYEVVDWGKMNTIKWAYPKVLEQINHNYYNPPFIGKEFRDSSLKYYKRAIELDSTQFYYIQEYLIYLFKFGDDKEIQELIPSKINNYNTKEKRWLEKLLTISSRRLKEMGARKSWIDLL